MLRLRRVVLDVDQPLAVLPRMRVLGLIVPLLTLFALGFLLGRGGGGLAIARVLGLVDAGILVTAVGGRLPV